MWVGWQQKNLITNWMWKCVNINIQFSRQKSVNVHKWKFGLLCGPPSSSCGGLVAFGHLKVAFGHLGGPFGPSQWFFVFRMGIFGGVSFLTFCDLRLILSFSILKGHFWVWFLSFENFKSCFGIRMGIFGGVSFLTFCDLRLIFGIWILRCNFLVWFLRRNKL